MGGSGRIEKFCFVAFLRVRLPIRKARAVNQIQKTGMEDIPPTRIPNA
jgi:hypothetical protein